MGRRYRVVTTIYNNKTTIRKANLLAGRSLILRHSLIYPHAGSRAYRFFPPLCLREKCAGFSFRFDKSTIKNRPMTDWAKSYVSREACALCYNIDFPNTIWDTLELNWIRDDNVRVRWSMYIFAVFLFFHFYKKFDKNDRSKGGDVSAWIFFVKNMRGGRGVLGIQIRGGAHDSFDEIFYGYATRCLWHLFVMMNVEETDDHVDDDDACEISMANWNDDKSSFRNKFARWTKLSRNLFYKIYISS